MVKRELACGNLPPEQFSEMLHEAAAAAGLTIGRRGTLKTVPQSLHWHLTKPGHSGTLESMYDPTLQSGWLSYHSNRVAGWIDPAIEIIQRFFSVPRS